MARLALLALLAAAWLVAASPEISKKSSGFRHADASRAFFPLRGGSSPAPSLAGDPTRVGAAARARGNERNSVMRMSGLAGIVAAGAVSCGSVFAQDAVQWRVEDGGNGHWYRVVTGIPNVTWFLANTSADAAGGHLVTFEGVNETDFVLALVLPSAATLCPLGPWVGLVQDLEATNYSEPSGAWRWIDGSNAPIRWQPAGVPAGAVAAPQDDCFGVSEDHANMSFEGFINDLNADPTCVGPWPNGAINSYIIEWSADCNSDGLVDFGQIRAGDLADANANNIPDCCEQSVSCDPCAADVDQSGAVNGVDLAAVLSNWGTSGGKYPRADINGDGTVDASDLAAVLNGWGACP